MGLGAVLILFPAWLPDKKSVPLEDSVVEIMQSALLAFSAALMFATAPHAGPYRAIYRAMGFLTVAALIAEIGGAVDDIIEERNLRTLKSEEVIRFAESPPDIEDGEHDDILRLNQQFKKNEGLRRGQAQEISG